MSGGQGGVDAMPPTEALAAQPASSPACSGEAGGRTAQSHDRAWKGGP